VLQKSVKVGVIMRLKILVCGCLLFFTSLFAHVETVMAQTQDWDTLLANMVQDDPALAAQWEKAKKAAEKNEKDLKKFSDKHFQKSSLRRLRVTESS